MMTLDTVKIMVLLSMLLLLFVGNALASENESISSEDNGCSACHNTNISTQPAIATQAKCDNCHGNGHGLLHMIDEREDYHLIHNDINRSDKECARCHYTPDCSTCHITHMPGTELCSSCHGPLSFPNGHADVRSNFSSGKHSWMGHCNTCHSGDKLNISGSYVADLNESNVLCDTCHSAQMNNMSQGEHGVDGNKCVGCHNPHATYSIDSAIFSSEAVGFDWKSLNRILSKNRFSIAIFCALGITLVSKHLMTRYEKDMVILPDHLMTVHEKEHSDVLHIKIYGLSVVDQIFDSIERMDIKVLSAKIKKSKHILVLCLDFSASTTSKEELLENMNEFRNVISAEYSDDCDI